MAEPSSMLPSPYGLAVDVVKRCTPRPVRWAAALPLLLLLLAWPWSVRAYLPGAEEVIAQLLKPEGEVTRVILEAHTRVFDPFAAAPNPAPLNVPGQPAPPGAGQSAEPAPVEMAEREFRQQVYWIRNRFLAVETFSMQGELVHFFLTESFRPVSVNLSADRFFADLDVFPPFFPFLEGTAADWRQGAIRWGVQPTAVQMVRTTKGAVYYRLYESPAKAVWVDRSRLRPVRIETVIEGGDGTKALTIEFDEFMIFGDDPWDPQSFVFPRTVNYLLDGRLFKQTTVRVLDANPSWRRFPLTRLRNKARELVEPEPLTLSPQEPS